MTDPITREREARRAIATAREYNILGASLEITIPHKSPDGEDCEGAFAIPAGGDWAGIVSQMEVFGGSVSGICNTCGTMKFIDANKQFVEII